MNTDIFYAILTIFLVFSIINIIRYIRKVKKILQLYKDNPNIQGIAIIDGKVQIIEKKPSNLDVMPPKEIILDPVCGKAVEKKDAYRVMRNDKEYFFCSWECREKFLQAKDIYDHNSKENRRGENDRKECNIKEGNV